MRARAKRGRLGRRRVCGVLMMDSFLLKGFHNLDVPSSTWTINTDVVGLLLRDVPQAALRDSFSCPAWILPLAYHCQVDYKPSLVILKPRWNV